MGLISRALAVPNTIIFLSTQYIPHNIDIMGSRQSRIINKVAAEDLRPRSNLNMSIERPATFYHLHSPPPLSRDLTLTVFTHKSIRLITGETSNRSAFYATVGKNGVETALLMAVARGTKDEQITFDISVRPYNDHAEDNLLTTSKEKVSAMLSDEQIKAWVQGFNFHDSLICSKEVKHLVLQNAEVCL